ncbi:beta-propeller fold lactonase family protein [Amycolatopsis mongoliensis]|uniref:Beta-propeller fold lactonase family protein n=1 Tax=Amycolatopsis mongoliensis TaxID=715475 RepID=A0A9Y2NHU5_9PSEU|nr:beta-propeller fold lactonase family protein [Amycolatopsis sp. 4-36]WIY02234.1 beta-propeller fold lactonase family protein [Amycolatopsis sp. 4-36]
MKFRFRPDGRAKLAVIAAAAALVMASGSGAAATTSPGKHAGPAGDGTAVTPVGFRVTPAGRQTGLGDLPLSAVFFPDQQHLVVANAGNGPQSLQVVDTATGTVTQTITYDQPEAVFTGLAFSPDGTHLYVSGGGSDKIRVLGVSGAHLTEQASIPLTVTDSAGRQVDAYPAGLAVTPDGARLVVADQLADAATVVDLATGHASTISVGHAPYGVTLAKDGRTAYVTNRGGNTVSVLDVSTATPAVRTTVTVGTHPNQSVLDAAGRRLYVADGDSDQVSVLDTATNRVVRTLDLAPYPNAPVGSNPLGLTLSPDGRTLYVANSGNNDVAVIDVDRGQVTGLIPTGWYPASVLASAGKLFVLNAKGLGAGPNPDGPSPFLDTPESTMDPAWRAQFIGTMMVGTLSTITLTTDPGRLAGWTRQVVDNNGFALADRVRGGGNSVVPGRVGGPTPIKHVIYVVKEARTYDQMLGDLGKGNGAPELTLFGEASTPNLRALANRFVTLDNTYANAEVGTQGWSWATAANSNSYTEQTWGATPRRHTGGTMPPAATGDPAVAPNRDPAGAYLWDRLADKGISFRNYGFAVAPDPAGKLRAPDPKLDAHTDPDYVGFQPDCADSAGSFAPQGGNSCMLPRIEEWKREFAGYVAGGNLPTVQFVSLPNDFTFGNWPGKPTPPAYIGDNDWALGQLVEAVSHSKYWADTAIFVTESNAQAGADHVDAHRTTSLVVSPYTQTGKVDSTFYSTVSVLRTIELIVGIKPLTQFDAYATPMTNAFTDCPSFTPYTATKPSTSFTEVNPPPAGGGN